MGSSRGKALMHFSSMILYTRIAVTKLGFVYLDSFLVMFYDYETYTLYKRLLAFTPKFICSTLVTII